MIRLIILLIISFKLVASDTLALSLATLSGTSNYEVWQKSSSLKSKLVFPFNAKLLHVGFDKKLSDRSILSFNYATKITTKDRKGEDYDWQNDNLTVYSFSKNKLNNYQSFLLSSSYEGELLTYFFSFSYKYIQFSWSDTSQIDYIKDKQSLLHDRSVTYQQDELFFGFSPSYSYNTEKIKFSLMPSFYYGVDFTKDKHIKIKRGFYTEANYKGFAYGVDVRAEYRLLTSTNVKLFYKSFYFKDDDTMLGYKNEEGFKFRSLPSSFLYKEHMLGIGIKYSF